MDTATPDTIQHPPSLSMADAARYAGRSRRTIRRWLNAGSVTAHRAGEGHSAPVRVDTASLRAYLASLQPPAMDTDPPACAASRASPVRVRRAPLAPPEPSPVEAVLREQLEDLRTERVQLREDLAHERDRAAQETRQLREDLGRARSELLELRRQLEEERKARTAVEREAAYSAGRGEGLRGLLTRWTRRTLAVAQ